MTPTHTPATATDEAQATLGAILLTGTTSLEPCQTETGLRPEHFYLDSHQAIYRACCTLADRGDGIDKVTITGELRRMGVNTITEREVDLLAAAPPVVGHAVTYARAVVNAALWRARQTRNYREAEAIHRRDEDAYNAATTVHDEPDRGQAYTADMLAAGWDLELQAPTNRIPTPWPSLTAGFNGGVMPGDTTVLAGHSSHGKSLVATGWLEHVATLGGRVALYTNEMTIPDLRDRLLAGMTDVSFAAIQSKRLNDSQHRAVREAVKQIGLVLIPVFGWAWQDVARHMRRSRWDLCCLDLFNRLPNRGRVADVDEAISGLCNAAGQAATHLIVCAQLNQERSKDAVRPEPTGRDLRESGALYNDPNNVMFVHRHQEEDEISGLVARTAAAKVWIDKARNGRPGARVDVSLNPYRMRFESEDVWRQRPDLRVA